MVIPSEAAARFAFASRFSGCADSQSRNLSAVLLPRVPRGSLYSNDLFE